MTGRRLWGTSNGFWYGWWVPWHANFCKIKIVNNKIDDPGTCEVTQQVKVLVIPGWVWSQLSSQSCRLTFTSTPWHVDTHAQARTQTYTNSDNEIKKKYAWKELGICSCFCISVNISNYEFSSQHLNGCLQPFMGFIQLPLLTSEGTRLMHAGKTIVHTK